MRSMRATWPRCAWPCHRAALAVLACVALRAEGEPPTSQAVTSTQPDAREIENWISTLSDPSYEKRTEATRRVCAIGQSAVPALKRAAAGDDYEAALQARNLLRVLDQIFFGGLEISLSVSKGEIAWNEPLALTLNLVNRSPYTSRVPFESPARREAAPGPAALREVADLVDVADFLTVTGPDGEAVELRVDDIAADPAIARVVNARVEGGPVITLPAGEKLVYRVEGFNRGWARYPLLTAGVYSISFAYEPQWEDEMLKDARVGYAKCAPVRVRVVKPAPEPVRTGRNVASMTVKRDGETLIARLTSTSDLPLVVNRNFGADEPPFAQVWWTLVAGEEPIKLHGGPESHAAAKGDFAPDKLVEVQPGESIEIDRMPIARLEGEVHVAALAAGAAFSVRATYMNRTDLAWQTNEENLIGNDKAPAGLREPLPGRMFTFQAGSEDLTLNKSR